MKLNLIALPQGFLAALRTRVMALCANWPAALKHARIPAWARGSLAASAGETIKCRTDREKCFHPPRHGYLFQQRHHIEIISNEN